MKPQHIYLLRHGESEGNARKHTYFERPDHSLHLTETGQKQAAHAGLHFANLIPPGEAVELWSSPFTRARETSQIVQAQLERIGTMRGMPYHVRYKEDPRLREIDWGTTDDADTYAELEAKRKAMKHKWAAESRFYFRMPSGESYAQVYDRLSSYLETLHRDFQDPLYPNHLILSFHGGSIKAFLMRFFHWSVEEFDAFETPGNCDILHIEKEHPGCYHFRGTLTRPTMRPESPAKPSESPRRGSLVSRLRGRP